MTDQHVLTHLDHNHHISIKAKAEAIVKAAGKTDPHSVLATRVTGMQLFLEKYAPEERRDVEYFSDSVPQYSPLIKRRADMETESPAMDRRTTRLQTKRTGYTRYYTIQSPNCPDDSVDS